MLNCSAIIYICLISLPGINCSGQTAIGGGDPKIAAIKEVLQKDFEGKKLLYSKRRIDFNISFISERIIQENYVRGFAYSNSEMVKQNSAIINKVKDSISSLNEHLNAKCSVKNTPLAVDSALSDRAIDFIVLISTDCENKLYVEVARPVGFVGVNTQPYSFQGEVRQYLFVFKKNNLDKVYKGSMLND